MSVSSPSEDWYRPLAAHLRSAYLRYSFAMNSDSEVDFLMDVLRLRQGDRLLDVGCGPGRHAVRFAELGVEVVGVDLSKDFIEIASAKASEANVSLSLFEMDAAEMPFEDEFDAVISLCEGAFSLGLDDLKILRTMGRAAKPGGRLAVGAVNVFYVLAHMRQAGRFDLNRMLYEEEVEVIGEDGTKRNFNMWNTCFTPRELQWIANGAGLDPNVVYGVSPGEYKQSDPTQDHPELLLLASKPQVRSSAQGRSMW
ncbi:MAG: class I SAM-dependent methyltransferase [Actinomycetota bacterium]